MRTMGPESGPFFGPECVLRDRGVWEPAVAVGLAPRDRDSGYQQLRLSRRGVPGAAVGRSAPRDFRCGCGDHRRAKRRRGSAVAK